MTTTTHVVLGDSRKTTYTVQTIAVTTGRCGHGHDSCGKPGVLAVRNTITQQRPDESSTHRIALCADHQDDAHRVHAAWVASARELRDPVQRAAFLASQGVAS